MSEVHAQARTTPRTRAEIKNSTASLLELAKRYNISVATARKWKQRDSPEDLSHRPHKLCTTLTPAQEAIAVAVRSLTLLGLDDLVAVVREFINPDVSRSGLDRCLRRHGVANLRQLQAQALADAGQVEPQVKTFKDYEPGFLHMDIKYLPRMPDEKQRRYLFVAIDRATRWVFMHIYADQSEQSSVDFLNRLERAAPMKIVKLLTDNGSQFTDRFTSKKREPTGCHDFDVRCGELGIEHRLCPPRHPQTNGMVERFNGRISEVVKQTRFASAAELETTLERYVKTYNQLIPQRALNHLSPIQALKEWQKKKPKLFKKRVYNQPGLDTYPWRGAGPARAGTRHGRAGPTAGGDRQHERHPPPRHRKHRQRGQPTDCQCPFAGGSRGAFPRLIQINSVAEVATVAWWPATSATAHAIRAKCTNSPVTPVMPVACKDQPLKATPAN